MDGSGFPPFVYSEEVRIGPKDFVARIPSAIHDKGELSAALAKALRFRLYYRHNWDALDECLSDLEWIAERRIVLKHDAAPHLPRHDLVIYLSILRDAVLCLRNLQDFHDPAQFTPRELVVAFPRDAQNRIAQAWSSVKASDYS